MFRHRKFIGIGMVFSRVPMFLWALRVIGFQAITGIWI